MKTGHKAAKQLNIHKRMRLEWTSGTVPSFHSVQV